MKLSPEEFARWDKRGEVVGYAITGVIAGALIYIAREMKDISQQTVVEGLAVSSLLMAAALSRVKRKI